MKGERMAYAACVRAVRVRLPPLAGAADGAARRVWPDAGGPLAAAAAAAPPAVAAGVAAATAAAARCPRVGGDSERVFRRHVRRHARRVRVGGDVAAVYYSL